ncbi:MAG: single-stranded DNA-binding protein [Bacteroidota bacterium]
MNMMKNRVQLIGAIGRDPEMRRFENGKALMRIVVTTSETYKNDKGDMVTSTQWHPVVAWGRLAERMEKYLRKGSEVVLNGKLTHRSYEDKEGVTKYVTEVVADEFMLFSTQQQNSPAVAVTPF